MNALIEKHSNYNLYRMTASAKNRPIAETDVVRIINELRQHYSKPYLRFMTVSGCGEAKAILYDGEQYVTKLVNIGEIEQILNSKSKN